MKFNLQISLFLVFFGVNLLDAKAQKVQFGLQAMTNYAINPDVERAGATGNVEGKLGGRINGNVDYAINNNFYFRSGIGLNLNRFHNKIYPVHILEMFSLEKEKGTDRQLFYTLISHGRLVIDY